MTDIICPECGRGNVLRERSVITTDAHSNDEDNWIRVREKITSKTVYICEDCQHEWEDRQLQ